jgi:hypothetical protein
METLKEIQAMNPGTDVRERHLTLSVKTGTPQTNGDEPGTCAEFPNCQTT